MAPLADLSGWKLFLLIMCAIVVVVVLVIFAGILLREVGHGIRVHRSRRASPLVPTQVRQEWQVKDPPAWDRWENPNKPGRKIRVGAALRGLGE